MLSTFGGDKHEFCLVVMKFKHVHSFPSFYIAYWLPEETKKILIR